MRLPAQDPLSRRALWIMPHGSDLSVDPLTTFDKSFSSYCQHVIKRSSLIFPEYGRYEEIVMAYLQDVIIVLGTLCS